MTAPVVPVSDEVAAARLLTIQGELSDLQDAVPADRHMVIDGVLVAVDAALGRLGYEPPEDDGDLP